MKLFAALAIGIALGAGVAVLVAASQSRESPSFNTTEPGAPVLAGMTGADHARTP
jgi:hypothetical protein